MPSFKVTKKAHEDLIAIGQFTQKEWGIPRRNNYLQQLDHCFSQLAENPELGSVCDSIAKGYRKFSQGSGSRFTTLYEPPGADPHAVWGLGVRDPRLPDYVALCFE